MSKRGKLYIFSAILINGGKALRKVSCLVIILLFCLSSIIPVVNSIYVEQSFDGMNTSFDSGLMDSCWPMKSHDVRHTGLSPYNAVDNNGTVKWKYEVDVDIKTGIVIDNEGVLYFGGGYNDQPWYIYALYSNGTVKWKYKTGGLIWSTPALAADGTIYIGTYDAKLYALNAKGTLKWKTSCGGDISSSPVIGIDGTVYFGTFSGRNSGGYVVAMNPNGTIKWRYETGYHVVSDPAIADDGTIYIGSGDYYFYAMNPDGTLRWRFKTGDWVKSHPAIGADGTIYFKSFDDYFYALNPDGSLKWKYHDVGEGAAGAAIDEDGIIYIGGRRLSALYPNGTLKWHYTFGTGKYSGHSSPAISADGTIYIGVSTADMYAGYIFAINRDGTLKWYKNIANFKCISSPSIDAKGNVYIGTSSDSSVWGAYGELYAFGTPEHPNKPRIRGPMTGKPREICEFTIVTTDYQGDNVEYYIDWDDETNSGWLGPYPSDENITVNHTWNTRDTYSMKVKARDVYGHESSWTTLQVTIPKSYIHNSIIELLTKIVKCFPLFERILNQIF
jgi:outer membrane protein assembly factor BamB